MTERAMCKSVMALAWLVGPGALGAAPITDLDTTKDRVGETVAVP